MNKGIKFLYSMKFAIIILIIIGVYSFGLVAFNEFYPAYTQKMFVEVVNSSNNINAEYSEYIKGKDISKKEESDKLQLEFIRETFYKDIHGWSDLRYYIANNFLQLFDQFKSFNYRFLLAVLTLSLSLCVISNTKSVFYRVFKPQFRSLDLIRGSKHALELKNDDELNIVSRGFRRFEKEEKGIKLIYLVKNSLSFSGAYIVHLGLVSIFLGGLLISLYGIRFNSTAWEYENTLLTESQKEDYGIDFKVTVNEYNVSYTDGKFLFDREGYNRNGYGMKMVADYVSDLSVIEDGKEIKREKIEVNSPLEHKGFTFFQANSTELMESDFNSIGEKIFDKAKLNIVINGKSIDLIANYRELTPIEGTKFSLLMEDFDCNYLQIYGPNERAYMRDQEITLSIVREGEIVGRYRVFLDPEKDFEAIKGIKDLDSITLLELQPFYKTGLEISTNPGSLFIWIGFLLSSIGLVFAFYLNYKQIFIAKFKDKNGKGSIFLAVNTKFDNDKMLEDLKIKLGENR
ncbi:MAG: hypothetical protein CR982_08385 [Candidatus Cloacimonadota bacterium]|nr:MAG: hypothetical protein CR982_08385 [Candidatus Cloacimonadota bacterium]PIE77901.1 MAG: hypothetical protein CSA15_10675 [Candidatus Delongbacteria bacterium]